MRQDPGAPFLPLYSTGTGEPPNALAFWIRKQGQVGRTKTSLFWKIIQELRLQRIRSPLPVNSREWWARLITQSDVSQCLITSRRLPGQVTTTRVASHRRLRPPAEPFPQSPVYGAVCQRLREATWEISCSGTGGLLWLQGKTLLANADTSHTKKWNPSWIALMSMDIETSKEISKLNPAICKQDKLQVLFVPERQELF